MLAAYSKRHGEVHRSDDPLIFPSGCNRSDTEHPPSAVTLLPILHSPSFAKALLCRLDSTATQDGAAPLCSEHLATSSSADPQPKERGAPAPRGANRTPSRRAGALRSALG